MEKTCIFCGKSPENKTKERIIPKWLIEFTKQNYEKLPFGPYYKFDESNKLILDFHTFYFKNFVYPACETCNNENSELERRAKVVVLKLLNKKPLCNIDFNLLLTWFDKIRIGLYIANIYNSQNIFGIQPKFYINQGAQSKDRMLLIYKMHDREDYLLFGGVGLPAFIHYPLSFFLIINNFGFLNICDDFLLAKRFGLPYPEKRFLWYDQNFEVLVPGTNKIEYPVINIKYQETCTQIYQPILNNSLKNLIKKKSSENHYKQVFSTTDSKFGKIFYKKPNMPIQEYQKEENQDWIPSKNEILTKGNIMEYLTLISLKVQNHYLFEYGVEIALERSRVINQKFKLAIELNKAIIDYLERLGSVKKIKF